ncbi:hypothetical protein [Microcoleus sp. AT3-D2]|uniref:hypothetical protein n=1 Tax=Microcoleus sp. AT3-D2 TaxID=2818612 RepID=UPI002FCFF840
MACPYSLALPDRIPDCDKKCNIIAVQFSPTRSLFGHLKGFFRNLNIRPSYYAGRAELQQAVRAGNRFAGRGQISSRS